MKEKEIALYVELAMKNLFFAKIQRENVAVEVERLLKNLSLEDVKKQLNK